MRLKEILRYKIWNPHIGFKVVERMTENENIVAALSRNLVECVV